MNLNHTITNAYKSRPIRFIEILEVENWYVKVYSISVFNTYASESKIQKAKKSVGEWLGKATLQSRITYQIATLIIHKCQSECFAIIQWWVDENMLENHVYRAQHDADPFTIFEGNNLVTCVWEMAVWWFERNAWIEHILKKAHKPDFVSYLDEHLNQDV